MLVCTPNYNNYEAVMDVTEIARATGYRFVMFTDGVIPLNDIRDRGWEPIIVTNPKLSAPENVRWVKFMTHRILPDLGRVLHVDGTVTVNDELLGNIPKTKFTFALGRVHSWLDELLRVYINCYFTLTDCVALATWAAPRYDLTALPPVKTQLVYRDYNNPAHTMACNRFWELYQQFPQFHRDQNLIPLALADAGLTPHRIDEKDCSPEIFGGTLYAREGVTWETHYAARRTRWVDRRPRKEIEKRINSIDTFITKVSEAVGITPQEFYSRHTTRKTISSSIKMVMANKAVTDPSITEDVMWEKVRNTLDGLGL